MVAIGFYRPTLKVVGCLPIVLAVVFLFATTRGNSVLLVTVRCILCCAIRMWCELHSRHLTPFQQCIHRFMFGDAVRCSFGYVWLLVWLRVLDVVSASVLSAGSCCLAVGRCVVVAVACTRRRRKSDISLHASRRAFFGRSL